MCELNAILVEGDSKSTIMEDVVKLTANGSEITITGMLGDIRTVRGEIIQVDLTKQEALIRKIN